MYNYKLYGFCVESDLEFPELVPDTSPEKRVDIILKEQQSILLQNEEANCERPYAIHKDRSYLENDSCKMVIEEGRRILYARKDPCKEELLRAYLLGWGFSILCHMRGDIAMHCSCVANDKGAVLISGVSGSGKTTLTRLLLENGFHLMADDLARVALGEDGKVYAYPAFPFQKMCRNEVEDRCLTKEELIYIDEYKDKYLVPYEGSFSVEPVEVQTLFMLTVDRNQEFKFCEITGKYKWYALMDTFYLAQLLGTQLYSPETGMMAAKIANEVPIHHLSRPLGIDVKEEMMEIVLGILVQNE